MRQLCKYQEKVHAYLKIMLSLIYNNYLIMVQVTLLFAVSVSLLLLI